MKYRPTEIIPKKEIELGYKLLIINEKQLAEELDKQDKLGFEVNQILEKNVPNASSDITSYKILLRKK